MTNNSNDNIHLKFLPHSLVGSNNLSSDEFPNCIFKFEAFSRKCQSRIKKNIYDMSAHDRSKSIRNLKVMHTGLPTKDET